MRLRSVIAILAALLLAGCMSVRPEPNRQCNFKIVPVEVPLHGLGPAPLEQIIRAKYASGGPPPNFLLMSGGSEHGSFGAGVLSGWAAKHGGLPNFELVTGVSTGAILASPAFAGDSEFAAKRYSDVWEKELLRPYATMRDDEILLTSYPSVLRHGAVASLQPMRNLLAEYLVGQHGFEKVAARADRGTLLVGAVDVDSGDMIAFDMTDMADRIVHPRTGDLPTAQLQECYYSAVQASAAAPLAAQPFFIDNRMYADGGMRFSLFGEKLMEILGNLKTGDPSLKPPNIYLIVNGTQQTKVWCPRSPKDKRDCGTLADAEAPMPDQPPNWALLPLGMRAVDILQNQVSRFSVHALVVENEAIFGRKATNLRVLRIESDAPDHVFPRGADPNGHKCSDLHQSDEDRDHPLQFHHLYMACIVDYGKERVENDPEW